MVSSCYAFSPKQTKAFFRSLFFVVFGTWGAFFSLHLVYLGGFWYWENCRYCPDCKYFILLVHCPHHFAHLNLKYSVSGYYIYIETSSQQFNNSARIRSPTFSTSGDTCVTFWYHMYGPNVNRLSMYVAPSASQQGTVMWTRSGNKGFQWHQASVDIGTVTNAQVRQTALVKHNDNNTSGSTSSSWSSGRDNDGNNNNTDAGDADGEMILVICRKKAAVELGQDRQWSRWNYVMCSMYDCHKIRPE